MIRRSTWKGLLVLVVYHLSTNVTGIIYAFSTNLPTLSVSAVSVLCRSCSSSSSSSEKSFLHQTDSINEQQNKKAKISNNDNPKNKNGSLKTTTSTANSNLNEDDKHKRNTNRNTIHLVSIPPLSDKAPRVVRDVWKWKDIVLGDGRDFFIPRPRALKALSHVVVGTSCEGYTVTECTILSNCARMDVLLSLERINLPAGIESKIKIIALKTGAGLDNTSSNEKSREENQPIADEIAKMIVGSCILFQLESFQSQRSSPFIENMSSLLDIPGMVYDMNDKIIERDPSSASTCTNTSTRTNTSDNGPSRKEVHLSNLLSQRNKIDEILRHFGKVAAGMAPRDSRPDRPVLFRPFSSRDAHIMLQLKRTADIASPKMKIILDAALNAGKAARDTKQCPVIKQLKGYDEGKYSQVAPPELSKEVADEVVKLAIEPAVERGIDRLRAYEFSDRIVQLRQQASGLYDDGDKESARFVNQKLHEPCMELRSGKNVDINRVLADINLELKER